MHLSEHKALIFTGIGISYSKSMVAYSAFEFEEVSSIRFKRKIWPLSHKNEIAKWLRWNQIILLPSISLIHLLLYFIMLTIDINICHTALGMSFVWFFRSLRSRASQWVPRFGYQALRAPKKNKPNERIFEHAQCSHTPNCQGRRNSVISGEAPRKKEYSTYFFLAYLTIWL